MDASQTCCWLAFQVFIMSVFRESKQCVFRGLFLSTMLVIERGMKGGTEGERGRERWGEEREGDL